MEQMEEEWGIDLEPHLHQLARTFLADLTMKERRTNMDNDNYYTPTAYWKSIEYEYATCSNCGFNEYTDWDCTDEAKEKIKTFHETYRYCPGCGRKMEAPVERRRS